MGEFLEIVKQLPSILSEAQREGGVTSEQIPIIIGDLLGRRAGEINCYPGIPGYECKDLAFFVSLTSPKYSKGRGHLTCRKSMEKIVQHMQGSCNRKTRFAVFITDSWDAYAFGEWEANFRQIQKNVHLEVYLLSGSSVSAISI